MPSTTERPSPVPLPLLGEKGLKDARLNLRCHAAARIRNRQEHVASRPDLRVGLGVVRVQLDFARSSVKLPPLGMASRPLTAKFTITWLSCPRSACTGLMPGWRRVAKRTCLPMIRRSIFSAWTTTAFKSNTLGSRICGSRCSEMDYH
jgi:hypothetical protein